MKQLWNRKGKRLLATLLAVLLVWNLCPQMGFAVSAAASAVSGNEATPSDAKEATENTELDEDESDEFADGDLENDLASPSDAEKNDTYITGNDEEVDAVQDMIASLPSIKEYNQLTAEEQAEVLAQVQEAMDAYNDLTEEQQKGIVGEEIFTLYEEFLTATPSNAVKAAAFEQSQTIDGITVRVTADAGVFPEDATLHVERIEDAQTQEKIQTAIEETTGAKDDPNKTVENTVVFDITILDHDGNELQPDTDKGQVKVAFEKVDTSTIEAGNSTLEAFHMNDDCTEAKKLGAEVDVDEKRVEMNAEHFSPFAITYVVSRAAMTVEIDTTKRYIIANGNALIVDGTNDTSTTVYIDSNRNGIVDSGEQSLATAGITGAPADGSDLYNWNLFGGAYNQDFSGESLITVKGGGIQNIAGGCANSDSASSSTFTGNTQIVMTGGKVSGIYGAGFSYAAGAPLQGNTSIKITGGTISFSVRAGGCGPKDTVSGNTTIMVSGASSEVAIKGDGANVAVSGTKTGIIYGMTAGFASDAAADFTNGLLQTSATAYSVVGDITLPDDFDYTLPAGTTLTVKEGATLHTGNAKFATEGTIIGTGTIDPKLAVAITGTNATTSETTYDVSQMFSVPASAEAVTYTIDTAASTGAGTIDATDGKTLSITQSGTITIKAETQETGFYAKGEATAVLTKQINAEDAVASVTTSEGGTTTLYATLAEAVTAANANTGSTLTLLKDIGTSESPLSMTEQLEVTGNFTLDFAGNTIYYDRNPALNAAYITSFMYVTGTLVIVDNGAEGKTGGISGNTRIIFLDGSDANATIKGGTYQTSDTNSYAIDVVGTGAVLSISGGVFKNLVGYYSPHNDTINITGGTFEAGLSFSPKTFAQVIPDGYMMYKTADDSFVDLTLNSTTESVYVKAVTGDAPYIREQPKSSIETLYEGYQEFAVLSIAVALPIGITDTLNYQWYQKADDSGTDTEIPSANATVYTLPGGLTEGSYTYYCMVEGNGISITSNEVTVTVAKIAVLMEQGEVTKAYGTISDAINNNKSGTYKLTLNADITDSFGTPGIYNDTSNAPKVTIDLNGYEWKIKYESDYTFDIIYLEDSTLTIMDSSSVGSGKVNLDSNKNQNLFDYDSNENIYLSGGTFNKLNINSSYTHLADGYKYYVDGVEQTITEDTVLENVTVKKPKSSDPNLNLTVVANPKDAAFTYDGTPKNISTAKGDNFTWDTDATASVEGYYTKSGDVYTKTTTDGSGAATVGGAPVNTGTYYVRVMIAGGSEYANTVSDYMEFEIMIGKKPEQVEGIYQISTTDELMWFVAHVNDTIDTANQSANAVLTADIDMTGITWPGMTSYAGTFDGAGFTIQNLNKGGSGEHQNAFIRTLETNGIVKCLKFDGATAWLHADGRSNAIIAETNNGTIHNCLVLNSSVSCGNYGNLAGIAAVNNNKIENCGVVNTSLNRVYSGASNRNTGGITEVNSGTVTNCFTYICSFTGGVTLGGIVASGTAPTNSYYYTTSNVTSTVDGTAKTTDEFASGEVTWLLNGSYDGETFMPGATDGTQVWYQLLGESGDTYPVLVKADGNTVYKLVDGTYSNSNVVATADKIIGHSLTPNGTISVNFYMEFTAETIKNQSQYYVQVKDAKGTVHETTELSDLLRNQTPKIVTDTAGAHSCYKISGAVAAKEMADKLTVKLMKRNGEQETEIFKEDYAVSDYFALAKQSGKTELIALTNAMAIYGAYSQQYFQYNTDTLATDLSGVDVSGVTAEALKDYTYNLVQTENAPISYYGTSLLLEADTTLRHYFKLSEGTASLEGLIFKIGDTVASPVQSTKDTSLYYVEIENIRAKDLELSYTVVVGTADTNYITVTNYSPLTYVKKALESSNTKAGLQPAMQALYLYWKEADKYNYPN